MHWSEAHAAAPPPPPKKKVMRACSALPGSDPSHCPLPSPKRTSHTHTPSPPQPPTHHHHYHKPTHTHAPAPAGCAPAPLPCARCRRPARHPAPRPQRARRASDRRPASPHAGLAPVQNILLFIAYCLLFFLHLGGRIIGGPCPPPHLLCMAGGIHDLRCGVVVMRVRCGWGLAASVQPPPPHTHTTHPTQPHTTQSHKHTWISAL